MKGKIIERTGEPKSYKYKILGEDNQEYFAHVGDLEANEKLVYESELREDLREGDAVDFRPLEAQLRGCQVKKV